MTLAEVRPSAFGRKLKRWRELRARSQSELADAAGVSPRHLSFVETGRAQPSRGLVLRLAAELDLPLRDRNELLLAAGFAPVFEAHPLGEPLLAEARQALQQILDQQEPYPALVMDRGWNILMANRAASALRRAFVTKEEFRTARAEAGNAMKILFHPALLRPWVVNWTEVAADLVLRLRGEAAAAAPGDPAARLLTEVLAYPGAPQLRPAPLAPNRPLLEVSLRRNDLRLAYFSTLTTFGTPHDLTLQELRVKAFFPADRASAVTFRRLAEP